MMHILGCMRTFFHKNAIIADIKLTMLLAICLSAVFILYGCTREYHDLETAAAEGARLRRGVVIDGLDLGGTGVEEAKSALEKEHQRLAEQTRYFISSENGEIEISASELPSQWNTDEVLLAALNGEHNKEPYFCEITFHAEECRSLLEKRTERLSIEPENAEAEYKNGKFRFTAEKDGMDIDVKELTSGISALPVGQKHEIKANTTVRKASYTESDAKEDRTLLSSYTTSFAKGNYGVKNRVFNIKKAASLIDGCVIKAGETFDMNAVLGARNKENGWREATAIREGSYVQEYGGGVCQVSTTLYNAALMADMEIVERRPHSWPLGYVGIGRDATISTGGPNFRFTNTSGANIYISALTDEEEKTIKVSLFGRKRTDGMKIRVRSTKVESIDDPGDEIRVDKNLPAGKSSRLRESRAGSISETYKQYYGSDGKLVREELVTRDKYRPIKGIVLVSGKKKVEPEKSETTIYG